MLGKRISGRQNKIVLCFKKYINAWDFFKIVLSDIRYLYFKNQRQFQEVFPNPDNK